MKLDKKYTCSCPVGLKYYICKHIYRSYQHDTNYVAFCRKLKIFHWDNKKKKKKKIRRGRVAKALIVQQFSLLCFSVIIVSLVVFFFFFFFLLLLELLLIEYNFALLDSYT